MYVLIFISLLCMYYVSYVSFNLIAVVIKFYNFFFLNLFNDSDVNNFLLKTLCTYMNYSCNAHLTFVHRCSLLVHDDHPYALLHHVYYNIYKPKYSDGDV